MNELIEDTLKVSGTFSGSVQFSIQISYDAKLFAKDYFECNITTLLEGVNVMDPSELLITSLILNRYAVPVT